MKEKLNNKKAALYNFHLLEEGEYYRINGTKKKLYWDGEKFMKPIKNSRGVFDGLIGFLDKQPNNIIRAEKISIKDLNNNFK